MNEEKILKIGDGYAKVFIDGGVLKVQMVEKPEEVANQIIRERNTELANALLNKLFKNKK